MNRVKWTLAHQASWSGQLRRLPTLMEPGRDHILPFFHDQPEVTILSKNHSVGWLEKKAWVINVPPFTLTVPFKHLWSVQSESNLTCLLVMIRQPSEQEQRRVCSLKNVAEVTWNDYPLPKSFKTVNISSAIHQGLLFRVGDIAVNHPQIKQIRRLVVQLKIQEHLLAGCGG